MKTEKGYCLLGLIVEKQHVMWTHLYMLRSVYVDIVLYYILYVFDKLLYID